MLSTQRQRRLQGRSRAYLQHLVTWHTNPMAQPPRWRHPLAGIIIARLTSQREVARVRALMAEREAVLRANQLEATFEAMNDAVVIHDKQGQVLHTNAATRRLFGLDALPSKDEAHLRQELLLQAVQRGEQGQLLPEKRRPLSRLFAGEVLTGTQAIDVFVQTPDKRQL